MRALLLALFLLAGLAALARATPDALLEAARARAAASCDSVPRESLAGILCAGHVRIGVRSNYPNFGTADGIAADAARSGFEIEVARAIAAPPRLLVLDRSLDALPIGEARRLIRVLMAPETPFTTLVLTRSPAIAAILPRALHLGPAGLSPLPPVEGAA